jgi:hypothetical protein
MRHPAIRIPLLVLVATVGLTFAATMAGAAPTHAKNSLTGTADCGAAGQFTFVVNSANGQGQGTQNNGSQAEFTPAHLLETHQVFHPTAFDLTFTFTPQGGDPQSFTDTSAREHQSGDVVCTISANQSSPGGSFMLSGTVTGWIS